MGIVVDADSHVYEPAAIWDEYVAAADRAAARSAFWHEIDSSCNRLTVLNGRAVPDLNRSRLVRQAIWRPGSTVDSIGQLDPDVFEPLNPGAFDAAARLADMDVLGVDHAVVFPTMLAEYLPAVENPAAAAILASAYNDWVWDYAAAGNGRLHPVAILPLQSVLLAQRELDRIAGKGFGSVLMRPMFYDLPVLREHSLDGLIKQFARGVGAGGSLDLVSTPRTQGVYIEDQPFRPVWRHIEELGLVACVHPSLGISNSEIATNGAFVERLAPRLGLPHTVAEPIAYMQDADLFMTAALFHGLLEDHPQLRLAFGHTGISWVTLALEKAETYLWLSFSSFLEPVSLEPEEIFERRAIGVTFDSWEETVAHLPSSILAKATWGSRYPHHDAAGPDEARSMLTGAGVDEATIDRLMGANAASLFGLTLPAPA
jgi:predicted TIM-barrel fold metal-dependent hydrolase